MKTKIFALLLLLLAFTPMALAPEDKAERLKVNDQDWDREGQLFVVSLSCKFGIATAGERAGFSVRATVEIKADGKVYSEKGERFVAKVEGAQKDGDNYISIEPLSIGWDRDGFTGGVSVTASVQLLGPSGRPMGEPAVASGVVVVLPPSGEGPGEGGSTP